MNDTATATKPATAAKPVKPEKVAKAPVEKKIAGHALSSKLTFGVDKDGKSYGGANNPKRANSNAHASFAKYKEGMTLQAALDAGIPSSDLSWDLKHGFIKAA